MNAYDRRRGDAFQAVGVTLGKLEGALQQEPDAGEPKVWWGLALVTLCELAAHQLANLQVDAMLDMAAPFTETLLSTEQAYQALRARVDVARRRWNF